MYNLHVGVNNVFLNHFVISGLPETWIALDELCEECLFSCSFYIFRPSLQLLQFSKRMLQLLFCCESPQKLEKLLWTTKKKNTSPDFWSASGWGDNDCISIFGWTYPLNIIWADLPPIIFVHANWVVHIKITFSILALCLPANKRNRRRHRNISARSTHINTRRTCKHGRTCACAQTRRGEQSQSVESVMADSEARPRSPWGQMKIYEMYTQSSL